MNHIWNRRPVQGCSDREEPSKRWTGVNKEHVMNIKWCKVLRVTSMKTKIEFLDCFDQWKWRLVLTSTFSIYLPISSAFSSHISPNCAWFIVHACIFRAKCWMKSEKLQCGSRAFSFLFVVYHSYLCLVEGNEQFEEMTLEEWEWMWWIAISWVYVFASSTHIRPRSESISDFYSPREAYSASQSSTGWWSTAAPNAPHFFFCWFIVHSVLIKIQWVMPLLRLFRVLSRAEWTFVYSHVRRDVKLRH